jgi:hypothetical protein
MGKGRHRTRRERFEDHGHGADTDAASFFFDLKLLLPPGMTEHDVQVARQKIEHRLQRTLRKKDRVFWTAGGFFLLIATSHPARAGAAAERVQEDLAAFLNSGDTLGNRRAVQAAPKARPMTANMHGQHSSR